MSCRTGCCKNIVRKTTWLLLVALSLTIAPGVAYAQWLTDSGTVNVQVADKKHSVVDAQTAQGAFVSYFGDSDTSFGSSGTGVFDPFVRLQGTPTEQGYNTNGTVEFDTKVGIWTHAILISHIPQRPCPTVPTTPPVTIGSLTCFELFVDINENNSTPYISLNTVKVYFTSDPNLTGYPFSSSATTTEQYEFNGNILIKDVNQGSGRGDLRYDIPINGTNAITVPANCNYGNPACTTYFVLYSEWGTTSATAPDGSTYSSDGGFEEWQVRTYPAITLTKTPNPANVCNGSSASVTYTYVVTNTSPGAEAVSGSVVDDNGTPIDTTDDVTVGTFTSLAAGASQTFTHTFTVSGTRTNTATATATDSSGASATASATATVTGHNCTISITKTPSVTNVCNGSSTSVTYTYVVKNTGDLFNVSGSVSDDVYGSIGSFGPLAPGATATLTKTATVTASVTNTATATGTFTDGKPTTATATASATVTGHTCTISLTKTPDKTTVCNGSNTQVTYTYVVTNNSNLFTVSGSVVDDNATPGNTADDVTVGTFTNLAVGTSQTFTRAFTVNGTRTNTATASGTFNDPKPTTASATTSATVTGQNCAVGKLAPTGTTCSQFTSSTLPQLSGINYSNDGTGHISQNLNPGVFFYWTKVVASANGKQTITITQTNDGSPGNYGFGEAAGTALYNGSCTTISTSPNVSGTTVSFSATLTSGTYIAGVKYNAKTPAGQLVPTSTGLCDSVTGDVCYSFTTFLGSTVVDHNINPFVLTQGPVSTF